MIGDKGAYASVGAKVLERAAGHATGPYKVPNVDVEALAVYTNNPPCGAMRGFGANQAAFGIEGMLDILAEKVGIDGWEMRWRNVMDIGDAWCSGQIMEKSVGIKKTLLAVKDVYKNAKYAGIACGIKNVGIGNGVPEYGRASLRVDSPDRIIIHNGFTEMGQGLFTVLTQFTCEASGLPPEIFEVKVDTRRQHDCGMTTASRATLLGGMAVKRAAEKLRADLDRGNSLSDLIGKEYAGEMAVEYTTALEDKVDRPRTHITFGFATQVVLLDDHGHVKKIVAAHDVGRVVNPTLLEGQIEGSIHMGLGFALTEDFKVTNAIPNSYQLRACGLIRAKDMPEIETIFIEEHEPEGPYGAKGVGEIGLVPTAPAVAAALYAYDGIRRFSLPMKDSPAARAMRGHGEK
jgi:xanthine dehydrogenase molybdenum-binding subunit